MALPTAQRHHWIFSADPHHYHWDTLFVKGKEMWHGAEGKPDLRAFERLPRQVTLAELRENRALRKMKLLKNVRVLISSITDEEYLEILRMSGIVATPGIPLP
jgi:predicted RNA-binding protein with PUA-like domain